MQASVLYALADGITMLLDRQKGERSVTMGVVFVPQEE
jgi:hypothetical protein